LNPVLQSAIVRRIAAFSCAFLCAFYIAVAGTTQALAVERLSRIQSDKTLRVCVWPDYYGISFRNPKTLQLAGIDIDNAANSPRIWASAFNLLTARSPD
jgi:ABC-type amino acid transport substrate-binding protein